ncbi:GGDEF domain-containing protein [Deinococcus cavernae]|uniref:GGDEF domain-containing protein n=1 Tax=Deinococcus cavernae TaxID=2320857 RepID=UPI001F2FACAE|nr:GGDEF domain-containing protein [Deinococcus cavernae]
MLNRRAFEEDLVAWQTRAYNLALLDLDGLKGINDQEGHAQGDRLLQVFAGALEHELPYGAGLYRIGGDEFVVLLDSRDGERLNELVDTALLAARQVVAGTVGASMGWQIAAKRPGARCWNWPTSVCTASNSAAKPRRRLTRFPLRNPEL